MSRVEGFALLLKFRYKLKIDYKPFTNDCFFIYLNFFSEDTQTFHISKFLSLTLFENYSLCSCPPNFKSLRSENKLQRHWTSHERAFSISKLISRFQLIWFSRLRRNNSTKRCNDFWPCFLLLAVVPFASDHKKDDWISLEKEFLFL